MSTVVSVLLVFCTTVLYVASYDEFDPVKNFMPKPVSRLNGTSNTRVINGFTAKPNAYPYQAGIEIRVPAGFTWCGGAIISPHCILTAAHCLDVAYFVNVILGAHDRLNAAESGQIRMYVGPSYFKIHEGWNQRTLKNDIALILLGPRIKYTDKIQPIALPPLRLASASFESSPAVIVGWGYMKGTSSLSRYLQYANVTILNLSTCRLYLGQVTSTNICIDGNYGKGACYGDSGSPLVTRSGDKYIIGITSFISGSGCENYYPSVYSRVTSYLNWISAKSGVLIM